MSIPVDDRIRAALLWDHPKLLSFDDEGVRQWRRAMNLDALRFGELDRADLLSVAAHALLGGLNGENTRSANLRLELQQSSDVGRLFELLIALVLEVGDAEAEHESLSSLLALVGTLEDVDLRARLLLRLTAFAWRRRATAIAADAASYAVSLTDEESRLGVVSRRWAAQVGVEQTDFNPWAHTDTPSDPLIALPWIQSQVVESSAKIASQRLESGLAGVWDSGFRVGRTARDDLMSAQLQAEWCGDLAICSNVRQLLASDILTDPAADHDETRWGLLLWASEPGSKRVTSAIRAAERQLDAISAADLLAAVRRDPAVSDDKAVEVAAGLWDLLSDSDADEVLAWLPYAAVNIRQQVRSNVLGALLWRRSRKWQSVFFEASHDAQAAMAAAVRPAQLESVPSELLEALAQFATSEVELDTPSSVRWALRVALDEQPISNASDLEPSLAVELLDWRPSSLTPEAIATEVDKLVEANLERLRAAEAGAVGMAPHDVSQLLGRMASYLPSRHGRTVDALIATVNSPASPAEWQLAALEGLASMARAERLTPADREAIAALHPSVGPKFFGQDASTATLRAFQLLVVGSAMTADDIAWLANAGRSSDVQTRLVSMVALGGADPESLPAVDWSLVGGLFDPSDEVVIQALGSIGRRGVSDLSGASLAVSQRLADLYASGRRDVRREVVVTVATRPKLDDSNILVAAHNDRSWIVRHEAHRVAAS